MIYFYGVDCAKRTFDFYVCNQKRKRLTVSKKVEQTQEGFERLAADIQLRGVALDQIGLIIEASGKLHLNLVCYLHERMPDIKLYVINALSAKRCAQASTKLHDNRTDRDCARQLAELLAREHGRLHPWTRDLSREAARLLNHERQRLEQEQTAAINRLRDQLNVVFPEFTQVFESPATPLALLLLGENPTAADFARRRVHSLAKRRPSYRGAHCLGQERARKLIDLAKQTAACHNGAIYAEMVRFHVQRLELLSRQIAQIEHRLAEFFSVNEVVGQDEHKPSASEQVREQHELIVSVPGIGDKGAWCIFDRAGLMESFDSANAFCAMMGACPLREQSGTSIDRAKLTPHAHRPTRATLYMGAQNAARQFKVMKFYYYKARRSGHVHKQAVCACMNRMLRWCYGVVRSGKPFDPDLAEAHCHRQHPELWATWLREAGQEEVA